MSLYVATRNGVYRAEETPFESAERTLDAGHAVCVRTFEDLEGVFAGTKTGLYRSTDGVEWENLGVPAEEAWELIHHGGDLYVGTAPGAVYRSPDGGDSWTELEGLQAVHDRDRWTNALGPHGRVRALAADPGHPERLLAGVEAGGFYVSKDLGESWRKVDVGGQDDFHQVVPVGPEEYFVVCGRLSVTDPNHGAMMGGVFHTADGGETFTKVTQSVGPHYCREILYHDDVLYAGMSETIPPVWIGGLGAEGHLFESDDKGLGYHEAEYPGGPEEVVLGWGVHEGRPVAGTARGGLVGPGKPEGGRVIGRVRRGEWEDLGRLPADVHSLASYAP